MENYAYEESLEWVPREYPINDDTNLADKPGDVQQRQSGQAARPGNTGSRMSKSEALDLVESLKKSILVAALITFGVLSALVATHVAGSAANNTSPPSPSFDPSQQQDPNNSGGFFNQQRGGGGYQFGPGGSQPSSGTRTS